MNKLLAIGICTYKRSKGLERCLNSILQMKRPNNVELCLIIADNDSSKSAQAVVDKFRDILEITINYSIEKKQGIPFARNCILNKAKELDVSELIFIDDDEWVDQNWLINLWGYYCESNADVVYGYVGTEYPDNCPSWIAEGLFFQRPKIKTGTVLMSAATGNVIFNFKKIVNEFGVVFDEKYGLTGGSDTDFFVRASMKGIIIKSVSNAIVFEMLEEDRCSLSYLFKRSFRTGNNFNRYKSKSIVKKFLLLGYSISQLLCGIA